MAGRHVLFHDALEALRGGVLVHVLADEIVHHVDEWLVAVLWDRTSSAQHVQHVGALAVHHRVVGVLDFGAVQPLAQPDRAGVVGAVAEIVLLEQVLAGVLPILQVLVGRLLGELQVQAGRERGEAFRKPLIVVRAPTHHVAPPLVRHLVRRHFVDEIRKPLFDAVQQHIALGGVQVRAQRQIDQCGPGLAEIELRLLGDGDVVELRLAEPDS